jgi:uncharacterized protein
MFGIYWDGQPVPPLTPVQLQSPIEDCRTQPLSALHDCRAQPLNALNDCRAQPLSALQDCRAQALPVNDCRTVLPRSTWQEVAISQLRPHPLLRQIPLDAEHVVAFVPSLSQVVVLNRATQQLLAQLPRSHPPLSTAETAVIGQLAEAGLLNGGQATLPRPPEPEVLSVWMHVTNACNLRCRYCYLTKTAAAMSPAVARAAVDAAIRSALQHGFQGIAFKYAGGEPTLRMDTLALIHAYAVEQTARHGLALSAGILSNGTLLNEQRIAQIAALGVGLMISLDGLDLSHDQQRIALHGQGSVEQTLAGIRAAQAAQIPLNINITVTSGNIAHLPTLVRWLIDHELHFTLSYYRENDCSSSYADLQHDEQRLISGIRQVYAEIARRPPRWSLLGSLLDRTDLSQPHSYPCAAGHSYLVIDHTGRIAKCQMTINAPVSDISAPDPLGVIRLDPTGPRGIPVDARSGCQQCEWRYWCAGGCPVATLRATGRSDVQSPNCNIYRSLYPDLIRLEGQRLLYWHTHKR